MGGGGGGEREREKNTKKTIHLSLSINYFIMAKKKRIRPKYTNITSLSVCFHAIYFRFPHHHELDTSVIWRLLPLSISFSAYLEPWCSEFDTFAFRGYYFLFKKSPHNTKWQDCGFRKCYAKFVAILKAKVNDSLDW